jgi:hypothetical protein
MKISTPSKETNFNSITYNLVSKICNKIQNENLIYITDFVNESDLKNHSKLGFILANQTKVNIQNRNCAPNILIQDLQLSNSLKISKHGSRILSRNIDDLKINNIKDDKKILTGSYLITNTQIILFLKLMNLNDGTIISSTTTSRTINDEFKSLEGIKTSKDEKEENKNNIYRPFHL